MYRAFKHEDGMWAVDQEGPEGPRRFARGLSEDGAKAVVKALTPPMEELGAIEADYERMSHEGRFNHDSGLGLESHEINLISIKVMMRLALRLLLFIARRVA